MKKNLLSLLLLLNFTFYSCNENIVEETDCVETEIATRSCALEDIRTPEEAIQIALEFTNTQSTRSASPSAATTETITKQHFAPGGIAQNTPRVSSDTILYLVKGVGDPILINAHSNGPTILATFDNNNFSFLDAINDPTPGVQGLIAVLSPILDEKMQNIQNLNGEYLNGSNLWTNFLPPSYGSSTVIVEPKVQVEWGQWAPFNRYAPANCPAGCVAIAAAQAFTVTRHTQEFRGIPLNYDNLINVKSVYDMFTYPNETDTIARFVREIGDAVDMDYGENGSGAHTSDAIHLFTYGGVMNLSTSKRSIQNTLQNYHDGIVIISSRSEEDFWGLIPQGTGHCYLVDGFKKSSNDVGFMHVNYGWGPGFNGYFLENLLAPHFTDDAEYKYPHEWSFYCLYKNR